MQFRKFTWVMAAFLLAATLVSCNIGVAAPPTQDVNAIYTSAAETTIAQYSEQQTQTAQAVPPTPFPSPTTLPTFTPPPTFIVLGVTPFAFNTPGGSTPIASLAPGGGSNSGGFAVGCNNATFVGETIPDKTEMTPGQKFKKAWSFQNSGTCKWDEGYSFALKSGDKMDGEDIKITLEKDFVEPGKGTAFIVAMIAPTKEGEYKGNWQMKSDNGTWFGSLVWVDIVVKKP